MVDYIIKYLLPIITAIIAMAALYKGWVFPTDNLFEKRQKMSKLIYDLYEITEDDDLKNISLEYGYAAITKETILTTEQRKFLLSANNPVKDIDSYRKCSKLLNVKTSPLSFEWKNGVYNNKYFRGFNYLICIVLYCSGAYMATLPITFQAMLSTNMLLKIDSFPPDRTIGLILYVVIVGTTLVLVAMSRITKLHTALDLINRHNR